MAVLTWPLMMCMKRDINSGHSRRKWKWLKMIFGFLSKEQRRRGSEKQQEVTRRRGKAVSRRRTW